MTPGKKKETKSQNGSSKTIAESSYADALVSQWGATVDEARAVYRSWVRASRLRDETKSKQATERELLLGNLQKMFWMPAPGIAIPISERFQELADAISDLEMDGETFSMEDFKTIVKEPPSLSSPFRDWFLRHWIIPVSIKGRKYPLCVCVPKVISDLYKAETGLEKEDTGASIRQEIRKLKLKRPKSIPQLRMKRFEQENLTEAR